VAVLVYRADMLFLEISFLSGYTTGALFNLGDLALAAIPILLLYRRVHLFH
jgi:hypothetical protein